MSADISSLIQEAKKHFIAKRYQFSLELCEGADKQCGTRTGRISDLLCIIDLKIQCLVKIQRLDAALEEAKRMMRLRQTYGRGYLRAVQIEKLRTNYDQALKWHHQGIKHIAHHDLSMADLERQRARIVAILADRRVCLKPRDPFTAFPLEVLEIIALCFSHKEAIRCLRVSKTWKKVLEKIKPVTGIVDFTESADPISKTTITASLMRISKRPDTIKAADLTPNAFELLRANLTQWKNWNRLKTLLLNPYPFEEFRVPLHRYTELESLHLTIGYFIGIEEMSSILKNCTRLQIAFFGHVKCPKNASGLRSPMSGDGTLPMRPALRELTIHHTRANTISMSYLLGTSLKSFCNLRSLDLGAVNLCSQEQTWDGPTWSLSELQRLKHFTLRSGTICPCPSLPPSLQEYVIGPDVQVCSVELHGHRFENDSHRLPNLRRMRVHEWRLAETLLYRAGEDSGPSSLNELSLCLPETFQFESSRPIITMFNHRISALRKIRLESQEFGDVDLSHLVRSSPALEMVELCNARITGSSLRLLFQRLGTQLRYVCLRGCKGVSFDAVTWLRAQGVAVEVFGSGSEESGTRLRWI